MPFLQCDGGLKCTLGFCVDTLPLVAMAVPTPSPDTIKGTFSYTHVPTSTVSPIAFAEVEIYAAPPPPPHPNGTPGLPPIWFPVRRTTTDGNGSFSITVGAIHPALYKVRVYATTPAADVQFMGTPPPIRHTAHEDTSSQSSSSGGQVLDFSRTVSNDSSQFFNIADKLRHGLDYANARRDPRDSEPIKRVTVRTHAAGRLQFFNPVVNDLEITGEFFFDDLTLIHEYAHYLQKAIGTFAAIPAIHNGCTAFDLPPATPGSQLINTPEHAWMEGFADYYAQAVNLALPGRLLTAPGQPGGTTPAPGQPAAGAGTNVETPLCGAAQGGALGARNKWGTTITAPMIEDFVTGALWDLLDATPAEAGDGLSARDRDIFQIFDHELGGMTGGVKPTIWWFHSAWMNRGLDDAGFDQILGRVGIGEAFLSDAHVYGAMERGQPVVGTGNGSQEVFARTNGQLFHAFKPTAAAAFGPWQPLAASPQGSPVTLPVAVNASGIVEVIYRGSDSCLWHHRRSASGAFTDAASLDCSATTPNSAPAVAVRPDGRLDVFVRGADNAMWHLPQAAAGGVAWGPWESLGGDFTSGPAATAMPDGRIEVYGRQTNGSIWRSHRDPGGTFTGWEDLGGGPFNSAPTVVIKPGNRVEVFVRGLEAPGSTVSALWHKAQAAAGGTFGAWHMIGRSAGSAPAVRVLPSGLLEVFVASSGHDLLRATQSAVDGDFSAWESLGLSATSAPAVDSGDPAGTVFVRGTANIMFRSFAGPGNTRTNSSLLAVVDAF